MQGVRDEAPCRQIDSEHLRGLLNAGKSTFAGA